MPSPTDQENIVEFFSKLNEQHNAYVVTKIYREMSIEGIVCKTPNEKCISLFETAKVNDDIKWQLEDCTIEERYKQWSSSLKEIDINHLTEFADGVFQWDDMQMISPQEKWKWKDARKTLKRLRKNLKQIY